MPYYALSPITWSLLLGLLLLLSWTRLSRPWRALGVGLWVVLLLLCAPLGANALQKWLESMVPEPERCAQDDDAPLVLLSGGFEREPRGLGDYASFRFETWRRVRGAVDTWHQRGGGELWIAGGGPYTFKESALQARLARDWGVPVPVLRIETQSTTTWESAFVLRHVMPKHIRLVTSPAHQPRALLAFRAAGFDACAVDIGSDVSHFANPLFLLPQVSSIEKAEMAIYELVGMMYYRLRKVPEMR